MQGCLLVCMALARPHGLLAAGWPWSKQPPDQVTANCTIQPVQVEQGSSTRLRARIEATDSRKHQLAYVWSANGGQIFGSGPEVEVDASRLNPGAYSLLAAAQDAYKNGSGCTVQFQVTVAVEPLTASCAAEPAVVAPGTAAHLTAAAADRQGHALRYRWFTNGGVIQGQGAAVRLDTAGLLPGEYVVTTRVEDDWGHATDCAATVKVELPPPPPVPPAPENLAQIVFVRNQDTLGAAERQQLQKVLNRLQEEPAGRVSLESYAGPEERDPQKLAAARAEAVRRHLIESGISESRVQVQLGQSGRLGGQRNRTLDIIWIPQGMEY